MERGYFYQREHTVYNGLVSGNIKLLILSDLHYSNIIGEKRMGWILRKIEEINPDYIILCGDSIDSVDSYDELFWNFIARINDITRCFITFGSHDCWKYNYNNNGNAINGDFYYADFWDEINELENISVLNDDSYHDDRLFVLGYTQSKKYYYPQKVENKTIFHQIIEDEKENSVGLENLLTKIAIPHDVPSILSVHAPTYYFTPHVKKLTEPFTLVISGHTHNALVFPVLNEIWNSTRGIITPDRQWLQENTRNTFRYKDDKVIINPPLTMFSKCTGSKAKLNGLYPMSFTIVNFTSDIKYDMDKIYTKSRYSTSRDY